MIPYFLISAATIIPSAMQWREDLISLFVKGRRQEFVQGGLTCYNRVGSSAPILGPKTLELTDYGGGAIPLNEPLGPGCPYKCELRNFLQIVLRCPNVDE